MCEQHSTRYGQSLEPEGHRQASSAPILERTCLAESCDPIDLSADRFWDQEIRFRSRLLLGAGGDDICEMIECEVVTFVKCW